MDLKIRVPNPRMKDYTYKWQDGRNIHNSLKCSLCRARASKKSCLSKYQRRIWRIAVTQVKP